MSAKKIDSYHEIAQKEKNIIERNATIAIVGLGYVGLPLAMTFVKKGFKVNGYDVDDNKIKCLKDKKNYLKGEEWLDEIIEKADNFTASSNPCESGKNDIIIVAVPTPSDPVTKIPLYDYIISSAKCVGKNLKPGALVVLESTVGPGTTEGIFRETIEKESGLKAGKDFYLGYSPERVNPGDKEHRIENINKIVSGLDIESTVLVSAVYSQIVPKIFATEKLMEAELAKLMENIQRDTNIALANEFAKICDAYGLDVKNVIDAASTKWNFYRVLPSCGVGGHCLPDDPWFLIHEIEQNKNMKSDLIKTARKINEEMPAYTARKMSRILGGKPNGSKIAIIGLTYKKDINDIRNSPSQYIIDELKKMGYTNLCAHDPFIPDSKWIITSTLDECLKDAKGIVIAAPHTSLDIRPCKIKELAPDAVIVDGSNCLDKKEFRSKGITFEGIGR